LGKQVWAALAIVLLAGCSSGDESTTTSAPTSETSADDSTGASQDLPSEIEPIDWLTVANGLTLVSFEGSSASASEAVRAIDGEPAQIGYGSAADDPVVYVFELPAETTFDRFAVPDTRNSPGNTTFFGAIEIAGSATSATDGFEVLVSEELVELPEGEEHLELVPASQEPVRYIRLTLSGALRVEPEHGADKTVVRFSEIIGNGTQADVPMSEGFDGVWELTFADNPDGSGHPTELHQEGARVSGCIGFATVTGTVTGNVVRLNGVDTRDERVSAYLLVVDSEGQLRGMESTNNGVFRARIGRIAPDDLETDCGDPAPPAPLACGAVVYVNFDLDSAVIRPDSAQVIDDLHDGLATIDGGQVVIEGHTSTEGTTDYNQGLSERRAQAVVEALVERGTAPDRLEAVGKGETEPLVSESDEASRAINRRVEIDCTAPG
jgi:hypothetical protein